MVRLILALSLLFVSSAIPQVPANDPKCPTISVNGPSSMNPGEIAMFSVRVEPPEKAYSLSYMWTVSEGEIVSGFGTTSIGVKIPDGGSVTVTVEVKGLLDDCPSTASESAIGCPGPEVRMLEEFEGPVSATKISQRIADVADAAKADPNAQIYVIVSGTKRNPTSSIAKKRRMLADMLSKELYDTRIVFIDSDKNDDRAKIFLVPAGATPPMP